MSKRKMPRICHSKRRGYFPNKIKKFLQNTYVSPYTPIYYEIASPSFERIWSEFCKKRGRALLV